MIILLIRKLRVWKVGVSRWVWGGLGGTFRGRLPSVLVHAADRHVVHMPFPRSAGSGAPCVCGRWRCEFLRVAWTEARGGAAGGGVSCRGLASLHLQQPLLWIQRWGRLQVEPTSPRGPRGLLPEPPCALPAAACSARMQGPPRCASRAGPRAGPRAGSGQRVSVGAPGAPWTPSLQTPAGSSAEQVGPKPEPHGACGCVLRRPVACGSALPAGSPCHPEGRVPAEASA